MDKKIKNLFKIAKKIHKSDDFKKAFGKILKEVKKHLK